LSDLLTIVEYKNKLQGLTLAFVGDGNNVCNDLILACAKLGINIRVSTPHGFEPLKWVIDIAVEDSKRHNSSVLLTSDPFEAVKDADVITTDTFVSIGKEDEKEKRDSIFLPRYQVNYEMTKYAKHNYIFMHCLPARRGKEVSAEIIDGPHSVVWAQAENRLHVQKALLIKLLDKEFIE
jgi:ornithine carbamoyltransferase